MTKTEGTRENPLSAAPGRVAINADITEFFREALEDAAESEGVEASYAARAYLVSLLTDYARPGRLNDEALARPLTLLLQEALVANGPERFQRLQSLGDAVLYISGFFRPHLETRGVELKYVSALGARAYDGAAAMLRTTAARDESSASDVLSELSAKFRTFADLLGSLGDNFEATSAARTHRGTLRLYERWVRSGSAAIAAALTSRGLLPLRGNEVLH